MYPISEQQTKILSQLGLTKQQAKVYLALVAAKQAPVRNISKIAEVDRGETYRAILGLEKSGLVEKIISVPNIYKPVPMQQVLLKLLDKRTKEYQEIEQETKKTIYELQITELNETIEDKETQYTLIPTGIGQTASTFIKSFRKIKSSYDCITSSTDLLRMMLDGNFINDTSKILKSGVKVRYLIDSADCKQAKIISNNVKHLQEKGTFELKVMETQAQEMFGIMDKRELYIHSKPPPEARQTPNLRAVNTRLVDIVAEYFENKWRLSKTFEL